MNLANKILAVAEKHSTKASMQSSADINIVDCKYWISLGNENLAIYRGLKSLKYSLGIFSDTYKRLCEQARVSGFSEYVPN